MHTLAFDNDLIPVVAIAGGLGIALVSIVFGNVTAMVRSRNQEETKRELAAYIAEGSLTPEDAERIIKAESPRKGGCC